MNAALAVAAVLAAATSVASEDHTREAKKVLDAGMAVIKECTGEEKSLRCHFYEARLRRLTKDCFADEEGCGEAFSVEWEKMREENPAAAVLFNIAIFDIMPELLTDQIIRNVLDE